MKKTLIIVLAILCIIPAMVFAQSVSEVKEDSEDLRIISLGPGVTEIIYALGAGDQLVGRTDYCNYPQQALEATSVGTLWEPNLETILSLDADVAIAASIVDPAFIEKLNKAGIQAYQFYGEESLEGTYTLIRNVAEAIGRTEEAKAVVADIEDRISAVKAKVSTVDAEQRRSCIYMVGFGDWGDYAATGDTYLNDVIEAAGGINAAKEGVAWSISKELLLSEDPDIIMLGCYSYTDGDAQLASFISTAPYSELSASRTGNVYNINGDAAERQGVRTADCIEEIARLLYPELF